ncbi:MAG TPA: DUF5808 domain-containing protein [Humibacter sp.]|nr:DUF5808 domain-containing protein [Humibacter sp.]
MTVFALLFPLVMLTLVAAVMLAMPRLVPRTVPLGVRIPSARVAEPVVADAVRRYRVLTVFAWASAVVLCLILVWFAPALSVLVATLVFVALQVTAYITSRTAIQRAKRDEDWYAGATVRLAANLQPTHVRPPAGWFAAALVLLLATAAIGVALYPTLPATLVTHWGADGRPDELAEKSVWVVFGPLVIAAAVALGLFALSFTLRISPVRATPAETPQRNRARAAALRGLSSALLGQLGLVIALEFAWISLSGWLLPGSSSAMLTGTIVPVVLIVVALAVFILRFRRAVRPEDDSKGDADAPDDDRYWKAGLIYVNPDDPSFLVQKRFGVGWTLNFGHPLGIVIAVVLLAIIVGLLGYGILTGTHQGAHS